MQALSIRSQIVNGYSVHTVPKKNSTTIIKTDNDKIISTRIVTNWRIYIYYRKLNTTTRKDHLSLLFNDQMLESLAKHEFFYYLDGYSEFF
jgi:hypothetical protein